MPRYTVYETQTIRVAYIVEADSPDQAYDMVTSLGVTEYDEFIEAVASDINERRTEVETPDGWRLLEG
jgi:hypothetical protein